MAKFGNKSKLQLATCSNPLQIILLEAIKVMDFSVLCGHRDEQTQNEAFKNGNSKVQWPQSKHNRYPSRAVDIVPWPIPDNWGKNNPKELAKFYYLAGIINAIAFKNDIKIRWGGDWNGDNNFKDQTFDDLVHFELI